MPVEQGAKPGDVGVDGTERLGRCAVSPHALDDGLGRQGGPGCPQQCREHTPLPARRRVFRYATLLHQLLPALTHEEVLGVAAVQSVTGRLDLNTPLVPTAPFITPHSSMSTPALIGGGAGLARPGALSQAHRGVLFLNDVSEFGSDRLDAVRCAVDDGEVRLARRDEVVRYPARFQLVLATAPCPCGQPEPDCSCSPHARRRFLARITGPLLERVDLRARLHPPDDSAPTTPAPEGGSTLRTRVHAARTRAAQPAWLAEGEAAVRAGGRGAERRHGGVPGRVLSPRGRAQCGRPGTEVGARRHRTRGPGSPAAQRRRACRAAAVADQAARARGAQQPAQGHR